MNQKHKQKGIGSQGSTNSFLVYKTDISEKHEQEVPDFWDLPELREQFPGLMTGKTFWDYGLSQVETSIKFGLMLVKIDKPDPEKRIFEDDRAAKGLVFDVAHAINIGSEGKNSIWGIINHCLFACFLPDSGKKDCLEIGEIFRENLAKRRNITLTIGIATYPVCQYAREDIIENCHKALDHALFLSPSGTAVFDSVSLNISGDRLYQNGDIKGAISEYKNALILDSSNVNVHNSLGVCYGVLGAMDSALEEFKTAMHLDPSEIMPVYNAGLVHILEGRDEKGLEFFLKADEFKKEIFEIPFQIGKLYLKKNDPEKAWKYFKRATKLKSDPAAHRLLGDALSDMGRLDEAAASYRVAIKLNPGDAKALSAMGCLFDAKGENPDIAITFCRHSVKISPENGLFRQRLAKLYLKVNLLEEARKEFEEAARLGVDSSDYIEEIDSHKERKAG